MFQRLKSRTARAGSVGTLSQEKCDENGNQREADEYGQQKDVHWAESGMVSEKGEQPILSVASPFLASPREQ